jgi:hypothetical protein
MSSSIKLATDFYHIVYEQEDNKTEERTDQIVELTEQLGELITSYLHQLSLKSIDAGNVGVGVNAIADYPSQIFYTVYFNEPITNPDDQLLILSTINTIKVIAKETIEGLALLRRVAQVSIKMPILKNDEVDEKEGGGGGKDKKKDEELKEKVFIIILTDLSWIGGA